MRARRAVAVGAAGCLLALVAYLFDAAPLFVPAVGLALLGAATPGWIWATARHARVRRVLVAERVVEDQPLEATIEVRRGPLGLPGAEVVDPFTGARFNLVDALSPIRGARDARMHVVGRFSRRGLQRLPPPSLSVRDPLDLVRARTAGGGGVQELLVLPRTERVRWQASGRGRRLRLPRGDAGSEALAAVDLDGLRPYRPGTPASRIHWPAVARGLGLLERRLLSDGDARPLVVLDTRAPDSQPELVDAAVRAAASLALELAAGGCGLLLPGEQRPTIVDRELASWPAAHARLALVQGGARARAPVIGGLAGRAGALVYVAAAPSARVAAALSVPGSGPVVLVVPDERLRDGRPRDVTGPMFPTLSVSGCRGFLLGAGRERERPRANVRRAPA
ncbi:MAG: DUF58 domain-containing protein [Solirubrobacteraceae bacterium]